jgi:hypothetical protein
MAEELDIEQELRILGAMKSRIKGNPLCHRSGCHGKGTLGIRMNMVEGILKPILVTCECTQFGETEYKRLYDEISSHDARMNNLFLALDEHLIDLHRSTPSGFIEWKFDEANQAIRRLWYRLGKKVI